MPLPIVHLIGPIRHHTCHIGHHVNILCVSLLLYLGILCRRVIKGPEHVWGIDSVYYRAAVSRPWPAAVDVNTHRVCTIASERPNAYIVA